MIEDDSIGARPRRRAGAVSPVGRELAPGGLSQWSGKVIGLLADPAQIAEPALGDIAREVTRELVPDASGGQAWAASLRARAPLDGLETPDREGVARLAAARLALWVRIEHAPASLDRARLARCTTAHGWLWAAAASENVQLDVPEARTADEVTHVGMVRKRAEISHDEFGRHWVMSHGPLVLDHGPLFTRYVANVLIDDDANWDGFVEQRFPDSAAAREHQRQVAEEKVEVREDLQRFIGSVLSFEAVDAVGPVTFTARSRRV